MELIRTYGEFGAGNDLLSATKAIFSAIFEISSLKSTRNKNVLVVLSPPLSFAEEQIGYSGIRIKYPVIRTHCFPQYETLSLPMGEPSANLLFVQGYCLDYHLEGNSFSPPSYPSR